MPATAHQTMGNGGPVKMSRNMPNGQMNSNCPIHHPLIDKKVSLGTRLSEHMELHSIDGEEADSLAPNHTLMTPTPSPGADSPNYHGICNFSPAENRRNIIVPEIQPWPPSSPFEKGHPPPPAPRRVRKIIVNSSQNERNPMATNHFLREGFRYSRKGLSIDRWSRILFPFAFTLWNLYYWIYYLWYIQMPHSDRSVD